MTRLNPRVCVCVWYELARKEIGGVRDGRDVGRIGLTHLGGVGEREGEGGGGVSGAAGQVQVHY